jgi:hypothetical protein
MTRQGERFLNTFFKIAAALALVAMLNACTWVKVTPGGQKVLVSDGTGVSNCESKGEVLSKLKSRVAGVERNATKVKGELETLARNEASKMSGDTIVAKSNVRDGEQTFAVYRCRP